MISYSSFLDGTQFSPFLFTEFTALLRYQFHSFSFTKSFLYIKDNTPLISDIAQQEIIIKIILIGIQLERCIAHVSVSQNISTDVITQYTQPNTSLKGIFNWITDLIYSKHQPGHDTHQKTGFQSEIFKHRKWERHQPKRQTT